MPVASHKLKSLQTALKEAVDAQYVKREALRLAQQEEKESTMAVSSIRAAIYDLQNKERDLIVTEHAYLRFFERVLHYDLEAVKDEIIPKEIRARLMGRQYAEFTVGDSHQVVVRDGKVLTVNYPYAEPPKPPRFRELRDGDEGEVSVTDEHDEGQRGADL